MPRRLRWGGALISDCRDPTIRPPNQRAGYSLVSKTDGSNGALAIWDDLPDSGLAYTYGLFYAVHHPKRVRFERPPGNPSVAVEEQRRRRPAIRPEMGLGD